MMKIELRDYVCPMCLTESQHSTNHEGEIYCGCKKCGSSVLYFKGANTPFVPMFTLKKYRFDWGKPQERDAYLKMVSERGKAKKFKVNVLPRNSTLFFDSLKENEIINVFNPNEFTGQYITNKGRLHDWFEASYPNADILEGYYLVQITA